MKVILAPGWKTELDRGPDWLFVRLYGPESGFADASGIGESLSMLMHQEFTRRLVLELDAILEMPEDLAIELFALAKTLEREGGILRLSGLSEEHLATLRFYDTDQRLSLYRDREEAVLGFYRPGKPR